MHFNARQNLQKKNKTKREEKDISSDQLILHQHSRQHVNYFQEELVVLAKHSKVNENLGKHLLFLSKLT